MTNKPNKSKNTLISIDAKEESFIYDDDYIKNLILNPQAGKTKALIAAGYTGDYPAQKAYVMYKRLHKKIRAALDSAQLMSGLIGQQILLTTALTTDNERLRLDAAIKLMEYADFKPSDKVEFIEPQSKAQIEREIIDITARIKQQEEQS